MRMLMLLAGFGAAGREAGVVRDRAVDLHEALPRAFTQPLELVASFMQLQARWVEAAAQAEDAREFAHRLEAAQLPASGWAY